jgi:diguanylate cyclase (GGDEF)-like protein/putative nucleotidyltransferase with HDIG domain
MTSWRRIPNAGRVYLVTVIVCGLFVVLHSLYRLYVHPVGYEWFILAGLTLLSGSFTVKVPTIPARLSVSETFVFAAVLLFGPAAATMVVALDSLVISLWIFRSSRRAERVLFNFAAPAVAVWIAAKAFYALSGIEPLALAPHPIFGLVFPLLVLAVLYFLLNSWLIAIAVALEQRVSTFNVWRRNFLWLSLNYFSGASVAALLLPYLQGPGYAFVRVIGVLLPLLLISYLTLKTALGRVEDANRHLAELNRLYLSTIETLAMAIDAKDQITHGHIRRVQIFAVGLAKAMGVSEVAQIKAVEAAALLHDMGKLAVPEYILNKPGPLTTAEFEKMKLHASVGADILSAIEFPYPVVPIVRHHHENWDGTGYPDGLRGSDIPIGARILSVVDCFDALTSDRPYRPRLSDTDALRILAERRGRMYDPLIVDTFSGVYREISASVQEVEVPRNGLSALTRGTMPPRAVAVTTGSRLDDISASTEEMLLLYELARSLSGRLDLGDAADVISKHLRRLVPATTCVFFLYDSDSDELVAAHAAGENSSHFSDIRIAMGQRLSGWVAANRQTIVNSDPMLDLGEVARALKPPLRSCLSTPLLVSSDLVGVLTVYSTHRDAFSEDHRRLVEVVARQVSQTVLQAVEFSRDNTEKLRDQMTGLPNRQHLERFVASELAASGGLPCSILLLDVRHSTTKVAARAGQPSIGQVVDAIRAGLRRADLLFLYDTDRFVALLTQTDAATADAVGRKVAGELSAKRLIEDDGNGSTGTVVRLGRATAPEDGTGLGDLVRVAGSRPLPPPPTIRQSIH